MNNCKKCICPNCELLKECPICYYTVTIHKIEDCESNKNCMCFSDWIRDITDNLSIEKKETNIKRYKRKNITNNMKKTIEEKRLNCSRDNFNSKCIKKCHCPTCERKNCLNRKVIVTSLKSNIRDCIPMSTCYRYKDWITKMRGVK